MNNNIKQHRFAKLAKLGEVVFHTKDLANLWQIKDVNALYTTLTRYVKQGLLFRIYKGFYSLKPIKQLDPWFLGVKALHEFGYISTETVLVQAGIMQQSFDKITLISSKNKKFTIDSNNYYCRQLADKFLYQSIGLVDKNGFKVASVSRAVADLLYFNPQAYFDGARLINWKEVKKLQQTIGYPLTPKYYDDTTKS